MNDFRSFTEMSSHGFFFPSWRMAPYAFEFAKIVRRTDFEKNNSKYCRGLHDALETSRGPGVCLGLNTGCVGSTSGSAALFHFCSVKLKEKGRDRLTLLLLPLLFPPCPEAGEPDLQDIAGDGDTEDTTDLFFFRGETGYQSSSETSVNLLHEAKKQQPDHYKHTALCNNQIWVTLHFWMWF